MVPETVTVCVGSVLVCAKLGRGRDKTNPDPLRASAKTNPDAPRISFARFIFRSFWFV